MQIRLLRIDSANTLSSTQFSKTGTIPTRHSNSNLFALMLAYK